MTATNPYITGYPVGADGDFFGRDELLAKAAELFCGDRPTGHLEVCGPRRIGKSSVLHRVRQRLAEQRPEAVCVYWSSEQCEAGDTDGFARQLCEEVRAAYPAPAPEVSAGLSPRKQFEALLAATAAAGRRVFFLLDEFQGFVHKCGLQTPAFSWLRALTQLADARLVLLVATHVPLSEISQDAVTSGFHNIFEHEWLGPLDRPAALDLVRMPAKRVGLPLAAGTAERIYDLCRGHPFLTARCAFEAAGRVLRGGPLDPAGEDFRAACERKTEEDLEQLLPRDCDRLREDLEDLVRRSFSRRYRSVRDFSPAARALYRGGLCHLDGDRLRPTGALASAFLAARFGAGATDRPADEEEVAEFRLVLRGIEDRLRDYVGERLAHAAGPHWEHNTAIVSNDVRTRAMGKAKGKGLLHGTTLGELFDIASRVPTPDPAFRKAVEACIANQVSRLRSGDEHQQVRPSSVWLRAARVAVDQLRVFLTREGA